MQAKKYFMYYPYISWSNSDCYKETVGLKQVLFSLK